MQIGFVNSSKHWVSRQPQLRLRLLRLAPMFCVDRWRLSKVPASRNPGHVAITSGTARETGRQSKEKVLHLNSRAGCSKSFHHPNRPRPFRCSKFMKRYPWSFSNRRLSSRRSKFTQQLRQSPNTQISQGISPTLFVSKSGLREAILLREILGPPRSLQEVDATP